jgi:hypothetical protein
MAVRKSAVQHIIEILIERIHQLPMKHCIFLLVLAAILVSGTLRAQVPQLVNYQGRVAVNGTNFDGAGQFKFALVNADGSETFWSNDGTSIGGSEPSAAVTLTVTQGLYSLLLGDTALGANMTNIPSAVFSNPDVRLRVWFSDGVNGSELLTPDQRLAPAAYLADGTVTSASISDAAITAGKIGPGAVNGTNIAPASLDSTSFAVPGPPNDGQVLGYNNGSLTWTAPGGGVFSLNGTSAYYSGGNVGIGTNSPLTKLAVNTANGSYGFTHTAGAVSLGSYIGGSTSGATGGWLGTLSDDSLHFFVHGGQPTMTVSNSGNVGIGTASPVSKLEVTGDTRFNGQIRVNINGEIPGGQYVTMELQERPGESNPLWVRDASGNVLFYLYAYPGNSNSLVMYGEAYKTQGGSSWNVSSDRRLKQDVRTYEPGLDEVLRLRPVRFRYRDDLKLGLTSAKEEVGFIAQEVREVIPDAITEGKDGYLMLKADPIHWAAINAIQELNAKLEEQRAENAGLKQRLEKLEQRMNEKNGGAE